MDYWLGFQLVMGIPQNGGFLKETPIQMEDLGVPLFQETAIFRSFGESIFLCYFFW